MLEKILEEMKKIKDGNRKETLYAKYPPKGEQEKILNGYSQGYEDGTDNFYNAMVDIIRKHINDGWIPVEERLPEDEEMVLVTCQTKTGRKSVNRAWYGEGFWHGTGSMSGVIAWRPLPEPYQPETETQRPEWKDRMLRTFLGGCTYD